MTVGRSAGRGWCQAEGTAVFSGPLREESGVGVSQFLPLPPVWLSLPGPRGSCEGAAAACCPPSAGAAPLEPTAARGASGRPRPRAVRRGAGVGDDWEMEARGEGSESLCFNDFRKSEFCELRSFLQSISSAGRSSYVLEGFLNRYRSLPKSRGVSFLTGSCIL